MIPVVQAGLAVWTAYQFFQTGKDIANDKQVQESWEKGEYIDTYDT